jgi:hypothetical protein
MKGLSFLLLLLLFPTFELLAISNNYNRGSDGSPYLNSTGWGASFFFFRLLLPPLDCVSSFFNARSSIAVVNLDTAARPQIGKSVP